MTNSLDQLAPALIAAQSDLLHIVKSKKGGHGTYAPFPDVIEHVRPILNRHGLALTQHPIPGPDHGVTLQTMLVHTSGQTLADGGMFLPAPKLDPQGFGSAHSYLRRYGVLSILGVATDDDDGNAALRAVERAENARTIADAAPKLSPEQAQCLEWIAAACGVAGKDRSDLLADDYGRHVSTAIKYAVKQGVLDAADAPMAEACALACDVDALRAGLGLETAA
jgi:hypothetical protein